MEGPWPWGRPRGVCSDCGQWGAPGFSVPRGAHQRQRGKADSVLGLLLVLTVEVPRKCLGDPKGARTTLREPPVQHRGELPAVLSGVVSRSRDLDTAFDASTPGPGSWQVAPAARTLSRARGPPRGPSSAVDGRVRSASFWPQENNAVMRGRCPYVILQVRVGGVPGNSFHWALRNRRPLHAQAGAARPPSSPCTPPPCSLRDSGFSAWCAFPRK